MDERDEYEMFLEAAIVYGRSSLHRLQSQFKSANGWDAWWGGLREDPSVNFFRRERNFLLKERPTKVSQVVRFGVTSNRAQDAYCFQDSDVPATRTVCKHLDRMEELVQEANGKFAKKRRAPVQGDSDRPSSGS